MKILVWGLGYVGTVTASCLAELGHEVVGIEPNLSKVRMLSAGQSPVKEPGLDSLVSKTVAEGRLRACIRRDFSRTLGGRVAYLCGYAVRSGRQSDAEPCAQGRR